MELYNSNQLSPRKYNEILKVLNIKKFKNFNFSFKSLGLKNLFLKKKETKGLPKEMLIRDASCSIERLETGYIMRISGALTQYMIIFKNEEITNIYCSYIDDEQYLTIYLNDNTKIHLGYYDEKEVIESFVKSIPLNGND